MFETGCPLPQMTSIPANIQIADIDILEYKLKYADGGQQVEKYRLTCATYSWVCDNVMSTFQKV